MPYISLFRHAPSTTRLNDAWRGAWRRARRWTLLCCALCLIPGTTAAQQDGDLAVQSVAIVSELDALRQHVLLARGELRNQGETAYADVTLSADVYDAAGEVIGEGFGFLVNACGTALPPGFALQPGESQLFSVTLEVFEPTDVPERVDVIASGSPTAPAEDELPADLVGITPVSDLEVVAVEWIDGETLRFGVGCAGSVFTNLDWYSYTLAGGETVPVEHPDTARVTQALLDTLGLSDPLIYNQSFLTFSPTARRLVYQNDLHMVQSAEPDGSFRRLIFDDLARHTLQGLIWLPEGRFLAYYFGAYGETVRYFTASVEGQRISGSVHEVLPSLIVPGPTRDGARVVIAANVDGVTGYYLKDAFYLDNELLFEGQPPGNNYPAPLYVVDDAGQRFIYIVRDVNATPLLQCFDMQTRQLSDLTVLPLAIATEERAWTWLSPDRRYIALAANGVNGGLWLVEPEAFGGCGAPLAG